MSAKLIEFRGDFSNPHADQIVSQQRLGDLLEDQEAAWLAFCQAHAEALAIQDLLKMGARIEAGSIEFDLDTCKARRIPAPPLLERHRQS